MARPVATDFLHSMRFQVTATDAGRGISLTPTGRADAGFKTVTTPEITLENVEYREGTSIYTKKFPGLPTVNDITLSRGVARLDTTFWDWARRAAEGSGEYRIDFQIQHFHRDTALNRSNAAPGSVNHTNISLASPARVYQVFEAFPIRCKVADDLDATGSDVSLMELDCSIEHFEMISNPAPSTP